MTTAKEIEEAMAQLPSEELRKFRAWYAEFDAEMWDREFEKDAQSGKLDKLADQALEDLAQGRCTDL
jgi:hypothetical protein